MTLRLRHPFPLLLLLLGFLFWLLATWPLARHFSTAIPASPHRGADEALMPFVPGDHVQLLFHFWLGAETLSGRIPPFANPYEFNLDGGNGAPSDLHYLPFSLVHNLLYPRFGHAAAWNAAGLLSAVLSVLFLGLLARRWTSSPAVAFVAAAVAAAVPYRWITLLHGSPTGFAMAFPPLLFYGLDRAVRSRSPLGGLHAGLALLFSYTTDLHVFYFSALAVPGILLLSLLAARDPLPLAARRAVLPLLPFFALAAAALLASAAMSRLIAGTVLSSGRTWTDVANNSPLPAGILSAAPGAPVYLGWGLPVLLAAALLFHPFFRRTRPSAPRPDWLPLALLLLAAAAVLLLALGTRGPFQGLPMRLARRFVPKYLMIRQSAKILCLLPALLAPLLALVLDPWFSVASRKSLPGGSAGDLPRFGKNGPNLPNLGKTAPDAPEVRRRLYGQVQLLLLLCALLACRDAFVFLDPLFSRLPARAPAYEAIAADTAPGVPPRALALPLWPGDSHWSSAYEHAALLTRVRLLNGYSPAAPADYPETVFRPLESLNQGVATDGQLDFLLARGIPHLAFHAAAFPSKVSPWSPAATLRALQAHPRLRPLADDGQTFAFRILETPDPAAADRPNWPFDLYPPTLHWAFPAPVQIPRGGDFPLPLRAPVAPAPDLRLMLLLADGSADPILQAPDPDGKIPALTTPDPLRPDWQQAPWPSPCGAVLHAVSGPFALRRAFLAAGRLPEPDPADGGACHIPPALLAHAGRMAPGSPVVRFDADSTPVGRVALFGPDLPFPPGSWDLVLDYVATPAPPPAPPPATLRLLTWPKGEVLAEAELPADSRTLRIPAITIHPDPIRIELRYTAPRPLALHDIALRPARITLAPAP